MGEKSMLEKLFNLTKKIGILSHIGFMGLEYYHPNGMGRKSCIAGLDFDTSNITIGVIYKI